MSNIILGLGEMAVSRNPDATLKTYALGSCVAAIFLDPRTLSVGMIHVVLPESNINEAKSRTTPGYFADTGIPSLLEEMTRQGCIPNGRGMIVKIAGGANILDDNETFNIGKRNILAIKKVLWQLGLGPVAEEVGGSISRTVVVSVKTGKITISTPGRPDRAL